MTRGLSHVASEPSQFRVIFSYVKTDYRLTLYLVLFV